MDESVPSLFFQALSSGGLLGLAAFFAGVAAYFYRAREQDRREKECEIRELNKELVTTMACVTQALTETRSALSRVEIYLLGHKK
jgi:cadmium resistance protein CadD (predicted permease)